MGENENLNNTIPANCPFKSTDSGLSVGCDVEHCAVGFNMSIFNPTTNKIESQLVCSLVANVLISNQANLLIQENTDKIGGLLGEITGIAKLVILGEIKKG